jgi:hypothetical protein
MPLHNTPEKSEKKGRICAAVNVRESAFRRDTLPRTALETIFTGEAVSASGFETGPEDLSGIPVSGGP